MGALATVEQATEAIRSLTEVAPPEAVSGPDARAMVEALCRLEKVAAGARALYAVRVAATGAYRTSGATSPAGWLSQVAGEPVGKAQRTLMAAEQLAEAPALRQALVAGEVSLGQAEVAAPVAQGDPEAEAALLEAAKEGSFAELSSLAQRTRRARQSEEEAEARERRVHEHRYVRTWSPAEGGLRLEAHLGTLEGARFTAVLDQLTTIVVEEARAKGQREPTERYRADALVRLATGGGAPGRPRAPRLVVRVDAGALRRGTLGPGEVCEIPGVGPVPVRLARELLGDAVFNAVVTDGIDVLAVTRSTRARTLAQEIALMERDPVCVVPGCGVASPLEVDHWRADFAKGGPTRLDNLCRLCPEHHAMKTHRGWRLLGGPGAWRFVGPHDPDDRAAEARRTQGPSPPPVCTGDPALPANPSGDPAAPGAPAPRRRSSRAGPAPAGHAEDPGLPLTG